MKFSILVLLFLFLALALPGCDVTDKLGGGEKPARATAEKHLFAADPPQKQVEKVLAQARPTPPGVQKDESVSTSTPSVNAGKPETTQKSRIADDPLFGEKVYRRNCALCHDQGIAGAPVQGAQKDWTNRLAKGPESLVKNALQGFQGSKGVMPARGGNPALSDTEVEAAVLFMLDTLERQ